MDNISFNNDIHLTSEELVAYVHGNLSNREMHRLELHLINCELCNDALEGIASIEAEGYTALSHLGAPRLTKVFTAGGGSTNPAWRKIRENKLGVPVEIAEHSEASYGAALLAMRAIF